MESLEQARQRIRDLETELKDVSAKLEFVAPYVETEDGIFSFPDGDYIDGCSTKLYEIEKQALVTKTLRLHEEKSDV